MKRMIRYASVIMVFLEVTAGEYLYPVGTITHDGSTKICLIHQKNMKLQIWFWDPHTKQAYKALPALYNAANFQVLPSQQAFSFIHNDTVHLKELAKRSPALIDFYGPHDLTQIKWDTDFSFYFSGREEGRRKIFFKDIYAACDEVIELAQTKDGDCLYPQKVNDRLFYIERLVDGTNRLVSQPCIVPLKQGLGLREAHVAVQEVKDVLYVHDVQDRVLGFLHMIDQEHGFFLSHASKVFCDQTEMVFDIFYYEASKVKFLCSFVIPLCFLVGKNRFYESIYAFLPYYLEGIIYFITFDQGIYKVMAYDLQQQILNVISQCTEVSMSLVIYEGVLYYGSTVYEGMGIRQIGTHYYVQIPYKRLYKTNRYLD